VLEYGLSAEDNVTLLNIENPELSAPYTCKVVRISGTEAVFLTPPRLTGRHKPLVKGKKYGMRFKSKQDVLQVWVKYTQDVNYRNRSVMVMIPQGVPSKAYERNDPRIGVAQIVEILALDYGDKTAIPKIMARMINISAGGARILTGVDLKIGDFVLLNLKLGSLVFHGLAAEVVNVSRKNLENAVGLKFKNIDETNRKLLVNYVLSGGSVPESSGETEDTTEELYEHYW